MSETETYSKGKFSLTEWEDVNYCEHYFCVGEEQLTDEEVVDLLNKQDEIITNVSKTIKELEECIEFDRKQGIKRYPRLMANYLLNCIKEVIK